MTHHNGPDTSTMLETEDYAPKAPIEHVSASLHHQEHPIHSQQTEKAPSTPSASTSAHHRIKGAMSRILVEMQQVLGMLTEVEHERVKFTTKQVKLMVENLEAEEMLRKRLQRLQATLNALEWSALTNQGRLSRWNLGHLVIIGRLADIQRDSASAVGALAVVGASLASSLLYSATRGNMWYPFVAWWFFVISLATTSGLSFATAGSSVSNDDNLIAMYLTSAELQVELSTAPLRATHRNWVKQQLYVLAVAFSLLGVAGGWAILAAGLAMYNLYGELHGDDAKISDGPDRGTKGVDLGSRVATYVVIGIFVLILIGGYFDKMRPRSTRANRQPILPPPATEARESMDNPRGV